MQKAYNRTAWANGVTPINETNLNNIEAGLDEVDNRVITLDTTKATKTEVSTLFSEIAFDEATGILTFTRKNGGTVKIDTKLEKLAINFGYDAENERLVITLDDGTVQYVDMAALITQYEFTESDTIILSVDSAGKVSATIKKGSITGEMLEPNYLANVTVHAENANASASAAAASAASAKSDADRAEDAADKATAIAGFTIDTELSAESANPIANKAVAGEFANYALNKTEELNTSILEKAVALPSNALRFYRLGGSSYTGGDLPSSNYAYGTAMVIKRYSETTVILFGISGTNQLAINRYASSSATWSGWLMDLTTAGGVLNGSIIISTTEEKAIYSCLKNASRQAYLYMSASNEFGLYDNTKGWILKSTASGTNTFNGKATENLPLTGGKITSPSITPLRIESTNAEKIVLQNFIDADGSCGYLGFDGANNPIFLDNEGDVNKAKTLLHTGNYADYAADVEDGTFTLTCGDLVLDGFNYEKIGRFVYVYGTINSPATVSVVSFSTFTGLPFIVSSSPNVYFKFGLGFSMAAVTMNSNNIATASQYGITTQTALDFESGAPVGLLGMYVTD